MQGFKNKQQHFKIHLEFCPKNFHMPKEKKRNELVSVPVVLQKCHEIFNSENRDLHMMPCFLNQISTPIFLQAFLEYFAFWFGWWPGQGVFCTAGK